MCPIISSPIFPDDVRLQMDRYSFCLIHDRTAGVYVGAISNCISSLSCNYVWFSKPSILINQGEYSRVKFINYGPAEIYGTSDKSQDSVASRPTIDAMFVSQPRRTEQEVKAFFLPEMPRRIKCTGFVNRGLDPRQEVMCQRILERNLTKFGSHLFFCQNRTMGCAGGTKPPTAA